MYKYLTQCARHLITYWVHFSPDIQDKLFTQFSLKLNKNMIDLLLAYDYYIAPETFVLNPMAWF